MRTENGFSLMETLVAVVIVGMTVAIFGQLLSSSMRLQHKARQKLDAVFLAHETFTQIMQYDMRVEGFPWAGKTAGRRWTLTMHPKETAPKEAPEATDTAISITLTHELFAFIFALYDEAGKRPEVRLVRYKVFPKSYFSEDFLNEHMNEKRTDNAFLHPGMAVEAHA